MNTRSATHLRAQSGRLLPRRMRRRRVRCCRLVDQCLQPRCHFGANFRLQLLLFNLGLDELCARQ
jgi:hypothetical protein